MNFFYPIEVQASRPEEIEISHVEMTETGLFFYQGQQLVLYIKDTRKRVKVLTRNPERAHKFHLTNCTTLGNTLHNTWILQRFIATARDDGFFYVNGLAEDDSSKECLLKLKVCRSCLIKLNYQDYANSDKATQNNIVKIFDVKEFFAYCDKLLTHQTETSISQPESEITVLVPIYFMQIVLKQMYRYFLTHWFIISKS